MNASNSDCLNILDLPNEVLFSIIEKVNMVDVLYSFVDTAQRFNQLIFAPFYIHKLNLTSVKIKSCFDRTFSVDDQILHKICTNILPQIYDQINELIVEQCSMERILQTINYPALYSLTLIDFSEQKLLNYLSGNLFKIIEEFGINQLIVCFVYLSI
jgi:hypothetical protein